MWKQDVAELVKAMTTILKLQWTCLSSQFVRILSVNKRLGSKIHLNYNPLISNFQLPIALFQTPSNALLFGVLGVDCSMQGIWGQGLQQLWRQQERKRSSKYKAINIIALVQHKSWPHRHLLSWSISPAITLSIIVQAIWHSSTLFLIINLDVFGV